MKLLYHLQLETKKLLAFQLFSKKYVDVTLYHIFYVLIDHFSDLQYNDQVIFGSSPSRALKWTNIFENTALQLALQLASIQYSAKFSWVVNFANFQSFVKTFQQKIFGTRHTILTL